jgi:hypothetical protein
MMLCCLCRLRRANALFPHTLAARISDDSSVMLLGKYTTDRFNYMPDTNTFHLRLLAIPRQPYRYWGIHRRFG